MKKLIFTLMGLIAGTASAAPTIAPKSTEKLLANKECVACNLKETDLSGQNLSQKNIIGSYFNSAKLIGTNFEKSDISSSFDWADATNANFKDSNLIHSTFKKTKLQGANFEGADVRAIDFSDVADLSNASFKGALLGKKVPNNPQVFALLNQARQLEEEYADVRQKLNAQQREAGKALATTTKTFFFGADEAAGTQSPEETQSWIKKTVSWWNKESAGKLSKREQELITKLTAIQEHLKPFELSDTDLQRKAAVLPKKLDGVSFEGANLFGVNFNGIELKNVTFKDAIQADLTGAKIGSNVIK